MTPPGRRLVALVAVAALSLLGTACDGSGGGSAPDVTTTSAAPPTPAVRADYLGLWTFAGPPASTATTGQEWMLSSLELREDGRFAGTDGCNSRVGAWDVVDGRLTFGSMIGPLVGCYVPSVPQELGTAARVLRDGDQLVLLDETGAETARLRRQDPPGAAPTTGPAGPTTTPTG